MAVAFGAISAKTVTGIITSDIAYPSGVSAGDLAVAGRCGWRSGEATLDPEPGWTQQGVQAGGTGTSVDAHTTLVSIDTLELTGSESGTVTFDNGATATGAVGVMMRYTKDPSETWSLAYCAGSDNVHGLDRSVTGAATDLAPGDVVVAIVAMDTDSSITITSPTFVASGITFGTVTRRLAASNGSTQGADGGIEVFDATVSTGSGTPVLGMTFVSPQTQCGPIAFLRLRAIPGISSPLTNPAYRMLPYLVR